MSWLGNLFGKYFTKDYWQPKLNFWGAPTQFNTFTEDTKKLEAVLSNPACLKVFALQCDLFSLGEVYLYNKKDKVIASDPAIELLNNPNPFQQKSQLMWDYMFWNMLGTAYAYVDSDNIDKANNKIYILDTRKLEFPLEMEKLKDKLIFSSSKENEIGKIIVKYRYDDGSHLDIPMSKIIVLPDLTNGLGNWFKSPSRIDALYKVICNADHALDANNINTRFSGKFIVAGQADPENIQHLPLSETEKKDVETKMNGDQQVHAMKSMVDVKRFVENLKNMELNSNYLHQYFIIGNMYGIPRDVLEAFNSSTYENQEKARASHVSYSLQSKGNDFVNALAKRWGYNSKGWRLYMDWSHLPFMQVFEKERALTEQIKINTFSTLIKNGVPIAEVNKYLDLNFTIDEPEPTDTGEATTA